MNGVSWNSKRRGGTSRDIAVLAVFFLGGSLHYVDLEDVAMKAAELSPRRFRWRKYPEQVHLEAVRLALKNELVTPNTRVLGGIRDGWMLTPDGLSWCLANTDTNDAKSMLDDMRRELDRARRTAAYAKTRDGREDDISKPEIQTLLRLNDYFPPKNRRERLAALTNIATLDPQLSYVLTMLRNRGFNELEATHEQPNQSD